MTEPTDIDESKDRASRWWVYCLPILCLPLLVVLALVLLVPTSAPPAQAAGIYTGQAFDTCAAPSASSYIGVSRYPAAS